MRLAIIPARGGSKRIPRKNIRPFHGKAILAYSIEAAQRSGLFDGVWVSTDDEEIAGAAKAYGAYVNMRPDRLASDDIGTQQVAGDFAAWLTAQGSIGASVKQLCCIYATAPMLTPKDLRLGLDLLNTTGYRYVYVPGWYYWGSKHSFMYRAELYLNESYCVLPDADRWIDINTEEDWLRAERAFSAFRSQPKE